MSKMENNARFDRRIAEYLKEYVQMPATEFDGIKQSDLTMEQAIAYNYVAESRTNTKVADRVMSLIKESERPVFEPLGYD